MDWSFIVIFIFLFSKTLCSPAYFGDSNQCPEGCTCTLPDQPLPESSPVYDKIVCNHTFLAMESNTSSNLLPSAKQIHVNCRETASSNMSTSFHDVIVRIAYPSMLETLILTSCNITEMLDESDESNSPLDSFSSLRSFKITKSSLISFNPHIFQNLCTLESVLLFDNIGLDVSLSKKAKPAFSTTNVTPVQFSLTGEVYRRTYSTHTTGPSENLSTGSYIMSSTQSAPTTGKNPSDKSTNTTLEPEDKKHQTEANISPPESVTVAFQTEAISTKPTPEFETVTFETEEPVTTSDSSITSLPPTATILKEAPSMPSTSSPPGSRKSVVQKCSWYKFTLLDLSGNNLTTTIDLSSFPFVHNIKELNLESNNLAEISSLSLQELGLAQIENIKLSHNNISSFSPDSLTNLPHLTSINVSHNIISDAFMNLTGTPSVTVVDLSHNNIENLSVEFFKELKAIEVLDLSHNNMLSITATTQYDIFHTWCPLIRFVNLSFNSLETVDELLFSKLEHLDTVDLRHNRLTSIPFSTFEGVAKLRTLNLANNSLTTLQYFHDLNPNTNDLVDVTMFGNPLDCDCQMSRIFFEADESLYPNWPYVSNFAKQRFIDADSLFCAKLHGPTSYEPYTIPLVYASQYPQNFFLCDYPDLCPLNTSCICYGVDINKFIIGYKVTDCTFANLTEIPQDIPKETRALELPGNLISTIPPYSFPDCACLETLDLRYNKISTIEDSAFVHLINLTTLKLDGNYLSTITPATFGPLYSLVELTLDFNELVWIDPKSFANLTQLEVLSLANNKLATLPDPLLYAKKISRLLLNNNMLTVLPDTLIAETSLKHPRENASLFYPEYLLQINLTSNRLTSIPRELFRSSTTIKQWQLKDLHDNELTSIPVDLFQTKHVDVAYLILHNNNLTNLPKGIFDKNVRSDVVLFLEGNPWDCDCSLEWLHSYLYWNGSQVQIPQDDEFIIYCDRVHNENAHIPLQNLSQDDFGCPSQSVNPGESLITVKIASSSVAGVIIFVILVSLIGYYKRQVIRYQLYHHLGIHILRPHPGHTKAEYKYDIFVSYSEEDRDFVLCMLRPQLEDKHFKSYVHEIDSIPGTNQLESIEGAIKASHRILIILSQNYINNERAADFEFNHALRQSSQELMDTLHIIEIERLEPEIIPINMQEYVGRKNWLVYDKMDAMFWDKLFEQLPRPRHDLKPDDMQIAMMRLENVDSNLDAPILENEV